VLSGLICWTVAGRREAKLKEHAMRTSQKVTGIVTTIGIDIGKNTFTSLALTSGVPSFCSRRCYAVSSNAVSPIFHVA
jgi:hypothetical protein